MRTLALWLSAGLAAASVAAAAAQAPGPTPTSPGGQVLISRPGDRLENVIETPDGSIFATGVLSGNVWRRAKDGTVTSFFQAPNPQGILPVAGGYVVDYQERAPDFAGGKVSFAGLGAHLAVLDRAGKVKQRLDGPDDKSFYNGMATTGANGVFISDYAADRILKADLASGKVGVWLDSDGTHDAAGPPIAGTAAPNGLKLHNGWVYFARGDVWKIRVGADGKPAGKVELVGKTGGTDDFDVAADGTIYASHGSDVVKVTPSGEVSTFLAGGCPFCTAVRVSRDGRSLYITGGSIPRPGVPAVAGYVSRIPLAR